MAKAGGPLREDGKRLKPPGWTPPDIAGVLAGRVTTPTDPLTLGQFTDALLGFPRDAEVRMDDGTYPTQLRSWRGDYAQLTLDHRGASSGPPVQAMLEDALAADGGAFEGYKGGTYTMRDYTPVWADAWGDYDRRAVAGLDLREGVVVVKTAVLEDRWV